MFKRLVPGNDLDNRYATATPSIMIEGNGSCRKLRGSCTVAELQKTDQALLEERRRGKPVNLHCQYLRP